MLWHVVNNETKEIKKLDDADDDVDDVDDVGCDWLMKVTWLNEKCEKINKMFSSLETHEII